MFVLNKLFVCSHIFTYILLIYSHTLKLVMLSSSLTIITIIIIIIIIIIATIMVIILSLWQSPVAPRQGPLFPSYVYIYIYMYIYIYRESMLCIYIYIYIYLPLALYIIHILYLWGVSTLFVGWTYVASFLGTILGVTFVSPLKLNYIFKCLWIMQWVHSILRSCAGRCSHSSLRTDTNTW